MAKVSKDEYEVYSKDIDLFNLTKEDLEMQAQLKAARNEDGSINFKLLSKIFSTGSVQSKKNNK